MIETNTPANNGIVSNGADKAQKIDEKPPIATASSAANDKMDSQMRSPEDRILLSAWKRLSQLDSASFHQKQNHVRVRALVILFSFLSSFFAVAGAAKNDWLSTEAIRSFAIFSPIALALFIRFAPRQRWWYRRVAIGIVSGLFISWLSHQELVVNGFPDFIPILVFVFAAVASSILGYAALFIPSQLWAQYRFNAEMIRRHIYLYRMQAGEYYNLEPANQRALLNKQIYDADDACPTSVNLYVPPSQDLKEEILTEEEQQKEDEKLKNIIQAIEDAAGKNTFNDLSVAGYIDGRLVSQKNWYIDKSFKEFRQMRRLKIASMAIGVIGSFLVFRGYAPWVAVTTAAAVSVNMLTNLSMYGRTYSIYLKAANNLERAHSDWNLYSDDEKGNPEKISKFVQGVEDIFKKEIDLWYQQVETTVAEIDKDFSQTVLKQPGTSSASGNNTTGTQSTDASGDKEKAK